MDHNHRFCNVPLSHSQENADDAPVRQWPSAFMGDGKEDFSYWCRGFERAVSADPDYNERSLSRSLPKCLGASAFAFWDSLCSATKGDYAVAKGRLTVIFRRTRQPGETITVFAAEISSFVEEAFPAHGRGAKAKEKFDRFTYGITPSLQLRCHEQGMNTIENASWFALEIEKISRSRVSAVFSPPRGHQCFPQTLQGFPAAASLLTPAAVPIMSANYVGTSDQIRSLLTGPTTRTAAEDRARMDRLERQVQRLQILEERGRSLSHRSSRRGRSPTPDGTPPRGSCSRHCPARRGGDDRELHEGPGGVVPTRPHPAAQGRALPADCRSAPVLLAGGRLFGVCCPTSNPLPPPPLPPPPARPPHLPPPPSHHPTSSSPLSPPPHHLPN